MKSVKPIVLLSFLFFASVVADDFTEPITNDISHKVNEVDDIDDSDYDFDDNDEDEDIVYTTGMISAKSPPPPPVVSLPSSQSLIKSPPSIQVSSCKKWRCGMNGYIPIWKSNVPVFCTKDYLKLPVMDKAYCQTNFCQQVCASF